MLGSPDARLAHRGPQRACPRRRRWRGCSTARAELDELIASRRAASASTRSSPTRTTFRAEHADAVRAGREARHAARARRSARTPPLVSVVIPYFRLDALRRGDGRSVFAQDHERLEVIVVNDGSLRPEDDAARPSSRHATRSGSSRSETRGSGARATPGIAQSRGEYVLPLDADNMHPAGVRRAAASRCSSDDPGLALRDHLVAVHRRGRRGARRRSTRDTSRSATTRRPCSQDNVAGDATAADPQADLRPRATGTARTSRATRTGSSTVSCTPPGTTGA